MGYYDKVKKQRRIFKLSAWENEHWHWLSIFKAGTKHKLKSQEWCEAVSWDLGLTGGRSFPTVRTGLKFRDLPPKYTRQHAMLINHSFHLKVNTGLTTAVFKKRDVSCSACTATSVILSQDFAFLSANSNTK